MIFFRNIFRSIYFVIILFFETLINFLIGLDWLVISPFFLLIYFVSTKRFDNQNIIPLVISGLSYDIFLSENYFLVKLFLVFCLTIFHFYLSILYKDFKKGYRIRTTKFFRIINEIPTLLMIFIILLILVKPDFQII